MRILLCLLICAPAFAEPISPAAERVIKAKEARAVAVPVLVDWGTADRDRVTVLPTALQAQADAVPLPVILPTQAGLADQALILAGPGWYAASIDADGHQISIHAHGITHLRPHLATEQKAAGFGDGRPRVARIHNIVSLAFERYGVGYVLDVECAAPGTDPRCADALYAMTLFDSLKMVGGRP